MSEEVPWAMDTMIRQPVLFLGHGSPMNAIANNPYTKMLGDLKRRLPTPRAILCVSAHWMTEGTWLTAMEKPKTIHDFYGFPQELFEVLYPAPGAPQIAEEIQGLVQEVRLNLDREVWGLDHGAWSVLRHMFPEAKIPVIQLSIYMERPAEYHFKVGQALKQLRERGILIIGSGNIVHNLRKIRWESDAAPYSWAVEFDEWVKEKLLARDFEAVQSVYLNSEAGRLSVPSPDHYYPFLYTLGAADSSDEMNFEFEEIHNSSISMRCVSFGMKH